MSEINYAQLSLDDLAKGNFILRQLLLATKGPRGHSLDDAVSKFVRDLPGKEDEIRAAAEKIRKKHEAVINADMPRAVVAGGIESWYPGPQADDPAWGALRANLVESGWSKKALKDLDDASTKVVAHLPNPHGTGEARRRGLVLGYVQSGKTTNFTAVIAKAADAGYRFFIVLSGIHNALRYQTQKRLNEQLWRPHPGDWYRLTDEDDFRADANVDVLLSTREQYVLAVVKKEQRRLDSLRRWLAGARREYLEKCPILIIDDEADQATVNINGRDRQPSRINSLIRDIVKSSPRGAYVGYTATPFANVLIDATDYDDLYPRDFIIDLPKPEFYIGPEAVFGREPLEFDDVGEDLDDGYDFVRSVPSEEIVDLRPGSATARHEFNPEITPSLDEAIRFFLLSTAARRVRGKGNPHATALVHTSIHTDIHQKTAQSIREHLDWLRTAVHDGSGSVMAELRDQWEEETERVKAADFQLDPVPWSEVKSRLPSVLDEVAVIVDNYKSEERLVFDSDNPRAIIGVGGNTFSRGLTLEGLAVSFFVRSASAYDTLLQMGRWFGYREGYADLTRIWMPDELREWFHHLATVEQEIRYDIERYESDHLRPDELGVRIRLHPKLAVTAASKMQSARPARVSYSGRRLQTILFNHRDRDWLEANIEATRSLVAGFDGRQSEILRPGTLALGKASSDRIKEFLARYRFHENSPDLDSDLISGYIDARNADGELHEFNVVVMGRHHDSDYLGEVDLGLGEAIRCINRARMKHVGWDYADIKALMSKTDRIVDLGIEPTAIKGMSAGELSRMRNTPAQGGRGDGSGLLLIYPVSKDSRPVRGKAGSREDLDAVQHVIGVGLVFPVSQSDAASLEYVTGNVENLPSDVDVPDASDELEDSE